jgi:hypothetical protein
VSSRRSEGDRRGTVTVEPNLDLLICVILIWSQIPSINSTGDPAGEPRIRDRIVKLDRVEMVQQTHEKLT